MDQQSPPNPPPASLYDQALRHHRQGDVDAAQAIYLRLLVDQPEHFGALHMMGVLAGQRQDYSGAVDWLERARAVNDDQAAVHYNLANALHALSRYPQALSACERALALRPDHLGAQRERGRILHDLGRYGEAVASYEALLRPPPSGRPVPLLTDKVRLDLWQDLGSSLARMGRNDEASAAYRQALVLGADTDFVNYRLASLGAAQTPVTAPEHYVRGLFNRYADRFDEHLVRNLGYRTPWLLTEALAGLLPATPQRILDLGCGTGLCGPLLRPHASSLVGVDLSPRMLDKANQLGLYDELLSLEAVTYLLAVQQPFDLILAADVLVYFGDLDPLFSAVRQALRTGGLFAFSVEADEQSEQDFSLRPTLRYGHRRSYLETLAQRWDYSVCSLNKQQSRRDGDDAIEGFHVVLRRN